MSDWLDQLPLLPKSKGRLEHKESWPEKLALQVFDRKVPTDQRTHGNALFQIRSVLDPVTVQEDITHVRSSAPLPFSERDQQVFLAVIQWLGTNIGRGFMSDFQKQLDSEFERRR
ncbi:hypothetical protein K2Q00_03335 [Patescibacteria group bacterium]|nr:hypothetical protein [Patescibacteria group bacterium]